MKTIYCISGLGADETAFQKLTFPENYRIIHLEWLEPFEDETLENYSKRFSEKISDKLPIIIGLSFGGIIAQLITKYIRPESVILISSTISTENIQKIRKLFRVLPFHKIIPDFLYSKTNFIVHYLFGLKSPEGEQLLSQIFRNSNLIFVKWAIQKLIDIESIPVIECPFFQIHGDNDKLISFKSKNPESEFIIQKGGHLMIHENADEVSKVIKIILKEYK